MLKRRPRNDGEQGAIILITTMSLTAMLLIGALAVDVGLWYVLTLRMQKAADAAALAAVAVTSGDPTDQATATQVALDTAMRNGYPNGGRYIVSTSYPQFNQAKVDIKDTKVPRIFSSLIFPSLSFHEAGTAEVTRPAPMGSPLNIFGADQLFPSHPQNFLANIEGACTPPEFGDPHSTYYSGNEELYQKTTGYKDDPNTAVNESIYDDWNYGGCPENVTHHKVQYDKFTSGKYRYPDPANPDPTITNYAQPHYRPTGYNYLIDNPAASGKAFHVYVYDGGGCEYYTDKNGVRNPSSDGGVRFTTMYTLYDTHNAPYDLTKHTFVSADQYEELPMAYDDAAHRSMAEAFPFGCGSWTQLSGTIPAGDTFRLNVKAPKTQRGTPVPPVKIVGQFNSGANPVTGAEATGIPDSNWDTNLWINPATGKVDPPTQLSGIPDPERLRDVGQNHYGLAVMSSNPSDGQVCSAITDTKCPHIYAYEDMAVVPDSHQTVTINMYLTEIDATYAGHALALSGFDAGDGTDFIQIIAPNGKAVPFTWNSPDRGTTPFLGTPDASYLASPPTDDCSGTINSIADASGKNSPCINVRKNPVGFASQKIDNPDPKAPASDFKTSITCPGPMKGVPNDQVLDASKSTAKTWYGPDHVMCTRSNNSYANERELAMTVKLDASFWKMSDGSDAPNNWFQVHYYTGSPGSDHSTWSSRVEGNPVHIVR